jgi:cytoplasmic iron level regulating protein YaaA (DUF328/UPF0246 family)
VLIVLSPAKTLDYESKLLTKKHTVPTMIDDSSELIDVLVTKSPDDIAAMMSCRVERRALPELGTRIYSYERPTCALGV